MSSGRQPPFPPPPPQGPPPHQPQWPGNTPYGAPQHGAPPSGPPPAGGWPPAPPGYPNPPRQPSGGRAGLVIALAAVAVLLLVGVVVAGFAVAGGGLLGDEDEPSAQDPGTTQAPQATESTESPSVATPSETSPLPVTPEPTETPGGGSGGGPGGGGSQTDRLNTADYPGDWDFKYEDVELFAKLVDTHDHRTCAGVEKRSAMTDDGCEYAVQWNYTAAGGKIRLVNMFLVYDSARSAKAAAHDSTGLKAEDFDLPTGSVHSDRVMGEWLANPEKNVVVVTLATSDTKMGYERFTDYIAYMNTDFRLALQFSL